MILIFIPDHHFFYPISSYFLSLFSQEGKVLFKFTNKFSILS